jgi:N-formylglutamate amidohydrolase
MDFNRSASEKTAAFTLHRSISMNTPVFMDSPHSGRDYSSFGSYVTAEERILAYSEDRWVDLLLADIPAQGVDVLLANFPRDLIDPNRSRRQISRDQFYDLDINQFEPLPNDRQVLAGYGLIPETIQDYYGRTHIIYDGKLPQAELERRLSDFYNPYHEKLDDIVTTKAALHGACYHINCHSMPNSYAPEINGRPVDFEIGIESRITGQDTASDYLTAEIQVFLLTQGYKVAVNKRFTGGQIISEHGAPKRGVHSIQLEINRLLYMDEETLEYDPKRAAKIQQVLAGINSTIMAFHTTPKPKIGQTPHIPAYMR